MGELTISSIVAVTKLMLILAVGFALTKSKIVSYQDAVSLGHYLTSVCMWTIILNIGFGAYAPERLHGLYWAFVLTFVFTVLGIYISYPVLKKMKDENLGVDSALSGVSNVGFIGTALISMMLGEESLVYLLGTMVASNMVMFTFGEWFIKGEVSMKSLLGYLRSPMFFFTVLGVAIYLLQIPVPDIIASPITSISNMTGAAAMLVAGSTLAQANLKSILTKKTVYVILLIRLIIVPLILIAVCKVLALIFPMDYEALTTSLVCVACPIASAVPVFAQRFGKDDVHAAGVMAISMPFAMFTIPLMVTIFSAVM